jgi:hypothetical protein
MFEHAAAGYGGHGTLCGTLGVCSYLINMVAYDDKGAYATLIDRLMYGYAETEFPTDRFDDICHFPKQVKAKAMTPLCHTSVSKWTMAAGVKVDSDQKKERCAKVAGEVIYQVVSHLNEYFAGTWTAPKWSPKPEFEHCWKCHASDDMFYKKVTPSSQQGHMDCLLCHEDHTKKYIHEMKK